MSQILAILAFLTVLAMPGGLAHEAEPATPSIGLTAASPRVQAPVARPRPVFSSDRIVVEVREPRIPLAERPARDIVLIPGLASTALVWEPVAVRLAETDRVHLVSVRGFGDLQAAANAQGAVAGPVAAEIARYVREQALQAPVIIGHSMGGQIALRLAAEPGLGLTGVMVVDAAPFFPGLLNPEAGSRDFQPIAALAYQAVLFMGDEALAQQPWRAQMGRAQMESGTEALESWVGWQGGDARVLAQSLYEVMTVDLRPRLAQIAVPVTVVFGWSRRPDSPRYRLTPTWTRAYEGLRTPARLVPVEGAEHMVMIDQPVRFMAAVDAFLTETAPAYAPASTVASTSSTARP